MMQMAKAYLLDPNDFKPGETYFMEDNSVFELSYMNGYFAWGYRNGQKELEAIPISLLKK